MVIQTYDGTINKRFGDTMVTAAGATRRPKVLTFNLTPYSGDSDRDGYRNKLFWAACSTSLTITSPVSSVVTATRRIAITIRALWLHAGGNDEASELHSVPGFRPSLQLRYLFRPTDC